MYVRKALTALALVLISCGAAAAQAQDYAARGREVERHLKAADPGRKLKGVIDGGHYVEQEWRAGGRRVDVSVYVYATPEEAARRMEIAVRGIALRPANLHLPGIGDEATATVSRRGDHAQLAFRKGGVYILIGAASLKTARRFAQDIDRRLAP